MFKMRSDPKAEAEVRSWGFSNVFTWTDPPFAHHPQHSHVNKTTHAIIRGSFTIRYPKDPLDPDKRTVCVAGQRVDVDGKKHHEIWVGPEGCTYVIGELGGKDPAEQ